MGFVPVARLGWEIRLSLGASWTGAPYEESCHGGQKTPGMRPNGEMQAFKFAARSYSSYRTLSSAALRRPPLPSDLRARPKSELN